MSPIIGGRALKGPAASLLADLGHEVSAVGVARAYAGLAATLVVDEEDADLADQVEAEGLRCVVVPTVMSDTDNGGGAGRDRALVLSIIPVHGIGEVTEGMVIGEPSSTPAEDLQDGDIVVVTQKIVSKAEGRIVPIDADDPRGHKAIVDEQAVRVLRRRGDLVITETEQGFVCANAGVDLSNVADGYAALLPVDADRSARRIRDRIRALRGVERRRDHLRHVRPALASGSGRRRDRGRRASPRSSICVVPRTRLDESSR